jgi:hypothetical protein
MKHLKNYNQFNDSINEEFLGALWQAAKGAFKNFLSGLTAPFKSLKDDFKKGLKREELKKKLTTMLDTLLKTTTDSINKAEDESVINQIMDQFRKEFDEKCVEIDKEIKAVKESNSINEGALQDSMIAGRVLLGIVRQKATEIKMEFDKKYAASKDLNAKKSARISEIKAIVEDFKKKVTDDKYIDDLIKKYKEENKIISEIKNGVLILDWGDVEVEIELPEKGKTRYKIVRSNSKKLIIPEGKGLLCDISGEIKKGDRVKFEKITTLDDTTPVNIDGKDFYETGSLEKITLDGKEVQTYKFDTGVKVDGQVDVQKNLTEIKSKKPDRIEDIKKFTDFTLNADDTQMKTMMDLVDGEMKK